MTSVLTTKHTCDEQGNWRTEPRVLTRTEKGWDERPVVPSPADVVLGTYLYRVEQEIAEKVRAEDEADEGWRHAEAKARARLIDIAAGTTPETVA